VVTPGGAQGDGRKDSAAAIWDALTPHTAAAPRVRLGPIGYEWLNDSQRVGITMQTGEYRADNTGDDGERHE